MGGLTRRKGAGGAGRVQGELWRKGISELVCVYGVCAMKQAPTAFTYKAGMASWKWDSDWSP